ncbi:contractile injection system protein, VgrG/Pvc8 family [Pseudomonas sp. DSP3-2-2]|uniref:contractile injection system protein, VgrG/Pvc8 family n=1 Tax=unclassified Pseudomonas TaxID=196821 RepID=UPI003CE872C2
MHEQPHFRLDVADLSEGLQVLSFAGTEAISQLFAFELEVLIDDPELDVHSLMYRAVFLRFMGRTLGVHGQIHGIERSHFKPGPACYQLSIGPRLACLGQRYTPRIFQDMTTPQIISRVLLEHGIRDDSYRFDLKAEFPVRGYCAQYRETDLQLVQRLCGEEGIHYHFQHSPQGHELIFGDGLRGFRPTPTARYSGIPMQNGVSRFSVDTAGADRSQQLAAGESTLPFVAAGHLLPLKGHPDVAFNHLWLVTAVQHRGFDPRQLGARRSNDAALYINHFQATPWEVVFKPEPVARWQMPDIQRARIVGPVDEPVARDSAGRVKARLDWGDQGSGALYGECWLPVAPHLLEIVRGGMQVVVSCVGEDPERPLITARLPQSGDTSVDAVPHAPQVKRIEANLPAQQFIGDEQCIQLDGGPSISYEDGCSWSVSVGDSCLRLDANGLKLVSPRILFSAVSEPPDDSL